MSDEKSKLSKVKHDSNMLYILLKDLDREKIKKYSSYMTMPNIQGILEDEELMKTADAFFENSLNISLTSKKIYMHRNTLVYRIEKIHKAIGLDIRKFEDAMAFKIVAILNELTENDTEKSIDCSF